jgi:hypothetical protein
MAKAKIKRVYQFNGADQFMGLIIFRQGNLDTKPNKLMIGFIEDNKGKILTEEQAKDAWLLAHFKHYPGFVGFTNIEGTRNKGFGMNVPWVAKRCNSIVEYRA